MEPIFGTFHDASTGETIVRELTAEEIQNIQTILETNNDVE